jgi:hypothetical protein
MTTIRATRLIEYLYNLEDFVESLQVDYPDAGEEDAMDLIEGFIKEDFGCGYGHEADLDDILVERIENDEVQYEKEY